MSSGSPLDDPQSFCRASPRSAYSSSTLLTIRASLLSLLSPLRD